MHGSYPHISLTASFQIDLVNVAYLIAVYFLVIMTLYFLNNVKDIKTILTS